jgi:hypothetical protein
LIACARRLDMGVRLTDDRDGLLPKEISGEGARAPQGRGKASAGLAGALFGPALSETERRSKRISGPPVDFMLTLPERVSGKSPSLWG